MFCFRINYKPFSRVSCTNINIYKGKLYICPIVSNSRYFSNYFKKNLEVTESDYLTIKEIKSIDEIKEFISKPTPFCRYCNIADRTFNNKWDVSKKDINEWV